MNKKYLVTLPFVVISSLGHATVLTGPFEFGTGTWSAFSYGTFEDGVSGWTQPITAVTDFPSPASLPYTNTKVGKLVSPGTYPDAGFNVRTHLDFIQINTDYILSGFFYRTASSGFAYLDLNDIADEVSVETDPNIVGEWQFAYAHWNSGNHQFVDIRAVMDNGVIAGQTMYMDDISLTPADAFVAPTPVPEPTFLAFGLPLLALKSRRRK